MREPAAIRYKNPGAMWPGPTATKWGSKRWIYLSDGTGQGGNGMGNKIAIFENWVDGICAQLDLWRTSPRYRGKKLKDALAVWSGGNHVESYIQFVTSRIPGMTRDTVMDDAFWRSPNGVKFLKVQAHHEAGKPMPVAEADWLEAQRRVFGGAPPKKRTTTTQKTGGSIAAGGTASVAANEAGFSIGWVIAIGVAVAVATFLIWKLKK
jgi:hypothetical protein